MQAEHWLTHLECEATVELCAELAEVVFVAHERGCGMRLALEGDPPYDELIVDCYRLVDPVANSVVVYGFDRVRTCGGKGEDDADEEKKEEEEEEAVTVDWETIAAALEAWESDDRPSIVFNEDWGYFEQLSLRRRNEPHQQPPLVGWIHRVEAVGGSVIAELVTKDATSAGLVADELLTDKDLADFVVAAVGAYLRDEVGCSRAVASSSAVFPGISHHIWEQLPPVSLPNRSDTVHVAVFSTVGPQDVLEMAACLSDRIRVLRDRVWSVPRGYFLLWGLSRTKGVNTASAVARARGGGGVDACVRWGRSFCDKLVHSVAGPLLCRVNKRDQTWDKTSPFLLSRSAPVLVMLAWDQMLLNKACSELQTHLKGQSQTCEIRMNSQ